jgi:hypothetical protein
MVRPGNGTGETMQPKKRSERILDAFLEQCIIACENGVPLRDIRHTLENEDSVELLLSIIELEVKNRAKARKAKKNGSIIED